MAQQNQDKFLQFRQKYPVFTYKNYSFSIQNSRIEMEFTFQIGEDILFTPKMTLDCGRHLSNNFSYNDLDGLIFHIGLIELISYWKCACSPTIHLCTRQLSTQQQQWWKKLYWKGLGEFFYQNGITTTLDEFVQFRFSDAAPTIDAFSYPRVAPSEAVIVPIGGGKDSIVTLEHHRNTHKIVPFIINPRGATLACASIAGFPHRNDIVVLERPIDKKLLELNAKGYLNGHTPFSAMLAFYTLLVGAVTHVREIALSNESSANEPTIPGTEINHQYSKSLEFEEDFRQYVAENMNDIAHYFSYLRPYSELKIAKFFSNYPAYFPVFKSCNAGSKTDSWCCQCPKCLFAYLILSPFINEHTMVEIFGEDLLDKPSLLPFFEELTGMANVKPFECVGTIEEVNRALAMIYPSQQSKYLIRHWRQQQA